MKILHNGVVRTGVPGRPPAQAVAVDKGRIAAVGSDSEILALRKPGVETVNLGGRLLLPGFSDTHIHMLLTGEHDEQLDLRGVKSGDEIVLRAKRYIENQKPAPGRWIVANGFDHSLFSPPLMPTRLLADAISQTNPVILFRVCYHVAIVNSAALALINWREAGDGVELDAGGKPTGVFLETAAQYLMGITPPSETEIERRLLATADKMSRLGLTAAHSLDVGMGSDQARVLGVFRALARGGRLPLRINQGVKVHNANSLKEALALPEWADPLPFFKLGFIKVIGDGSLGAQTAFLREPYADAPHTVGLANFTQREMDEFVAAAHSAGRQIAVHAIGDATLELLLQAVEKLENPQKLRHRVIHCMIGDTGQYQRIQKLGMCADIQPLFLSLYFSMDTRLGEKRAADAYAWKTLYDLGIPLGGGSDSPVDPFDPLQGIYWAVARQDENGYPENGFHPRQRLSVQEAVNIYTSGAAYIAFDERRRGTVEAGKLADFTVLTRDIFEIAPAEILNTRVYQTWVDGKPLYQA